ncbi:YceI family protein, partial [Mesorhizobium sp.]|uniref:YceI family protein n=1 Tax=Mesorhizobium sp. TaxID=1871066 RepID=UPI0025FDBD09
KPITFVSKTIRVTGGKTGTVAGLLTFRDETHPVTLDVTFNGSMAEHPMMGVPKIGFSATGSIRRSEWGLDFAIPELSDEVTFAIETQMVPASDEGRHIRRTLHREAV